jgi:bla regulator protein blaR1
MRRVGILANVVGLLVVAINLRAQSSDQKPFAFDVASIKPVSDADAPFRFRIEPNGTTAALGITVKRLLMTAYNVQGFRIVGGPAWVESQRWDVQATHEGVTSVEQIRQMLVTLVTDRFHLQTHRDRRTLPTYELVVERSGSKVPTTKDGNATPLVRVMPGSLQLTNATSATFASQLSYAVARSVLDKTHLNGRFDFTLEWAPLAGEDGGPTTAGLPPDANEPRHSASDSASIFTAIREQLGLRLKAARGPVDVLVIDHVEKPTPD